MIFLAIALGIFALDYNVKAYINSHRLQGTQDSYLGGRLIMRNCHNAEGGFGLFKGREELGKELSSVVFICTVWEFVKLLFTKGAFMAKLGLSMVLGGGMSNFYDRKSSGYVTDYFSFGVKNKKLRKIVFNLSDMFIFIGAAIYFIGQVIASGKKRTGKSGKSKIK